MARIALERPDGLVVDRLLDAGIVVLAVHPNQHGGTQSLSDGGGKSDRFDAYVLANSPAPTGTASGA